MALPELVSAEELFNGAVLDSLVEAGISALFVQFPFLNLPVVRNVVRWLISKFIEKVWLGFTDVVNLRYVALKNAGLQKKFAESALRLKGVILENGIDSEEYRNARKEHQLALAERVRSLLVPNP